jgi:hypothetical protein
LGKAFPRSIIPYGLDDRVLDSLFQEGVKGRFHLSDIFPVLFDELSHCLPVQQASGCQMVHPLSFLFVKDSLALASTFSVSDTKTF